MIYALTIGYPQIDRKNNEEIEATLLKDVTGNFKIKDHINIYDYNIDFERIKELIPKYERIKNSGGIRKYNEGSKKQNFILPLFEALGSSIYNRMEKNQSMNANNPLLMNIEVKLRGFG